MKRRALLSAWMLEAPGQAPCARRPLLPPLRRQVLGAHGAATRIDALAKLKALLDTGVVDEAQFAAERDRLLER